jgi:hypothetical protein
MQGEQANMLIARNGVCWAYGRESSHGLHFRRRENRVHILLPPNAMTDIFADLT